MKNNLILFSFLILFISNITAQVSPGAWNSSPAATTTPNAVGIGTNTPSGYQEINYCNDQNNGLVVTKYDCGIYSTNPNDFLNPTYDGKTQPVLLAGDEGGGSGSPTVFTLPISFLLSGYNTSLAKPMIWARVENNSSYSASASGLHTSRFMVTPYGRAGLNIENPRAALDIKSLGGYNVPATIIGRQSIGTTNRTQHMHFVPLLDENGYNQITIKNDQGIFFTDGNGTNGANQSGALVIAPWADQSNPAIGGLRMDATGNVEIHGKLRSTQMKVNVKWWSDFVFDQDYQLMPINELRTYIEREKHLPGVPSETEMLANGSDVAETQAIQMKKIEELNLYIIQLSDRISELEKQIKAKQ